MLPKYRATILNFVIGTTLLLAHVPVVNAHQVKTTQEDQICQDDQPEENSSKPSKRLPTASKVKSKDNNDVDPKQNEEFCQIPKMSETDNSSTSDKNFTDVDTHNADSNNLEEPSSHQSEGSNQDSHDFNFSIQLNTGGGASSESGETFPDTNTPSSTEPEIFSPTPSQVEPDVESNFEKPSKTPSPSPKPQPKKPVKPKLIKKIKESKHRRSRQLTNKSSVPSLKPMKEGIKPPKQIKPNKKAQIKDKRHIEQGVIKPNRPKQKRMFGKNLSKIPSQSYPFYNQKYRQPLKRGTLTYPAPFRQNSFKNTSHSLRNSFRFWPHLRNQLRPHNVFRHSIPRTQQIHRLHH
jgi:hypothetical protein